jgi:hypothetical protein
MSKQKPSPLPKSQMEELQLAAIEGRQPRCIYCEKPLDTIVQTQYDRIKWTWDAKARQYVKDDSGGDADPPVCGKCGERDWGFVDGDVVSY